MTSKATKPIGLVMAVLGLMAGAAGPAKADILNFSYSFPGFGLGASPVTATGTLTTSNVLNGDGSHTIIGVTGTRTYNSQTDNITGLLSPGTFGGNDNEVFATNPFLNFNGFAFTIDSPTNGNAGNLVNVYFDSSPGAGYSENSAIVGFGSFTLSPGAVPEPTSIILLGTVVLMVALIVLRRNPTAVGLRAVVGPHHDRI